MLAKTITFTDYNGTERTETFYFNLSKVELVKLESENEGLTEQLKSIAENPDPKKIIAIFEMLIEKSVGIKSDDGIRFMKSKEITEKFMQSPAYDALFVELLGNQELASDFMTGLIPSDLAAKAKEEEQKQIEQ